MSPRRAMDARTKKRLIDSDVMTSAGLTMTAKARRCPTCKSACWVGMALVGPSAGVWVSFTPTTPFGELLALSAGMKTYEIQSTLLVQRGGYSIAKRDANSVFVHVQHLCNGPPLPLHPKWAKKFPSTGAFDFPDNPPF